MCFLWETGKVTLAKLANFL